MEENENFAIAPGEMPNKIMYLDFKRRIYYVNYPFDIFKKLFVFLAVEAKEVGRTRSSRQRKYFDGFGKWKKDFRL
jgi:hypothetical protein